MVEGLCIKTSKEYFKLLSYQSHRKITNFHWNLKNMPQGKDNKIKSLAGEKLPDLCEKVLAEKFDDKSCTLRMERATFSKRLDITNTPAIKVWAIEVGVPIYVPDQLKN